jgi:hypothetical protein
MKWSTVRNQFPNRWVLFEAIAAKSINKKRLVDELAAVSDFEDTSHAWQAYKEHYLSEPNREY